MDGEIFDCLKYELDKHIYYYGSQFKSPREKKISGKSMVKRQLKKKIEFYNFLKSTTLKISAKSKKRIISNAYFSTNSELQNLGYDVFSSPWSFSATQTITEWRFFRYSRYFNQTFYDGTFNELISADFGKKVKEFKSYLNLFYCKHEIDALFVPNDISFYENLSISVFEEIKKPSFIFLHGIPGRYNNIDENRASYLIVWGEKIKENYVRAGFNPQKILVSGHPYYRHLPQQNLRFSLDNVLVISKSMNGAQHSDQVRLTDRGNLLYYVYSIQNILKRLGIKRARLRLHPSESIDWYLRYIDTSFYSIDKSNLSDSIKASSVVIGPTSTVMLETVFYGVNYAIFEPIAEGLDLFNFPLVSPFDGKDPKIPIAINEGELLYLLKNRQQIEPSVLKDYIQTPFNLDFIKEYI